MPRRAEAHVPCKERVAGSVGKEQLIQHLGAVAVSELCAYLGQQNHAAEPHHLARDGGEVRAGETLKFHSGFFAMTRLAVAERQYASRRDRIGSTEGRARGTVHDIFENRLQFLKLSLLPSNRQQDDVKSLPKVSDPAFQIFTDRERTLGELTSLVKMSLHQRHRGLA